MFFVKFFFGNIWIFFALYWIVYFLVKEFSIFPNIGKKADKTHPGARLRETVRPFFTNIVRANDCVGDI